MPFSKYEGWIRCREGRFFNLKGAPQPLLRSSSLLALKVFFLALIIQYIFLQLWITLLKVTARSRLVGEPSFEGACPCFLEYVDLVAEIVVEVCTFHLQRRGKPLRGDLVLVQLRLILHSGCAKKWISRNRRMWAILPVTRHPVWRRVRHRLRKESLAVSAGRVLQTIDSGWLNLLPNLAHLRKVAYVWIVVILEVMLLQVPESSRVLHRLMMAGPFFW